MRVVAFLSVLCGHAFRGKFSIAARNRRVGDAVFPVPESASTRPVQFAIVHNVKEPAPKRASVKRWKWKFPSLIQASI
ncbi:MAG: hypothetical protein A3E78_02125 [Alphaproteobacteria bacterium RIFCSPHIGHO2_12_FULL_63_12]|nr:MAG: hypothetical protein A3E78_02125 [Alphaproteobacteria bacterium RIFCSPHIGHO2_12_FULL_63_12]